MKQVWILAVHRPGEYWSMALFFLILGCALLSLIYPWDKETKRRRVLLHLPLVLPLLFIPQVVLMPNTVNIRVDSAICMMAMMLSWLVYLLKLWVIHRSQ